MISHTLGEPALFAITLSSVVAAIFFSLGVVAGRALGLTPVVFLLAGIFFAVTMATYVEGSSLHIERGGASTFARYAFDEFWSFVAGWAILLDYLIVMAISAVVISEYLTVFWNELNDGILPEVVAGGALLYVAMSNIRGLSANRIGSVLRLSLLSIVVLVLVCLIGFTPVLGSRVDPRVDRPRRGAEVEGRDLRARHSRASSRSGSRRRRGSPARSAWAAGAAPGRDRLGPGGDRPDVLVLRRRPDGHSVVGTRTALGDPLPGGARCWPSRRRTSRACCST
jgi:hypothetical protein